MKDKKIIIISLEEYYELKKKEMTLDLLEQGGVDNWEWYGESLYSDDNPDRNLDNLIIELKEELKNEKIIVNYDCYIPNKLRF